MYTLIAELEAATEGSEKLDVAICKAFCKYGPDASLWYVMLHYSRSFEAALTWMPENCVIELCQSCPARADDTWWDAYVFKRPRGHDSEPIGATEQGVPEPALAACIAIAKARQAMKEDG